VLSYACWKVRFGGDPNVVGSVVRLNKHPYVVVGVAPKDFQGTERFLWPELWVPVQNEEQIEGYGWLDSRGNNNSWDVGRLRTAVTVPQANADLAVVAAQLAKDHPDVDKNLTMVVARPGLLGDALGGPMHAFLYGVMGLAALVLLAACANLGGLFATRTADRARELGIRIAIGSSRGRIVRQLLTESVLISVIGGIAAAVVASVLLHGITVWHPHVEIPVQFLVEPDRVVILFSILLALLTGILFGIIPARQVWQTDPNQVLKAAGATSATQRRFALRDILLAVQIALCSLLVTASFVSFRGLQRTFAMPLGIHPEGVTLATLDVHLAGYNNEQFLPLERRLLDAVTHVPGVDSAAYANTTPLSANQSDNSIFAPGTTDFKQANARFWANSYEVSSAYFAVAGTHLLAGRVFTDHDDAHAPRVAIVNEAFARRLFGTTNVIGKHFPVNDRTAAEVVGVVEDGKYETLTEDPRPAVFWPMLQQPSSDTVLLVRSERGASETIPLVRKAIADVDPALPVFSLGTWSDGLSMVTLPARAATIALGVLGALAMMLAVTGIFGLASYTVAKRMHELGIRVALGAQSVQVLRAALGRTLLLLGIGSTTGLMLGVAASRVLASIIYQATASDPLVIISVVVTMALTGLVSAMVPARKAVSADPAKLLRAE
jgi:predicted permease